MPSYAAVSVLARDRLTDSTVRTEKRLDGRHYLANRVQHFSLQDDDSDYESARRSFPRRKNGSSVKQRYWYFPVISEASDFIRSAWAGVRLWAGRHTGFVLELYLPAFCIYLTRGLITTAVPMYVMEVLDMSGSAAGFAAALVGMGKIFADVPSGVLVDRIGSKAVMVCSSLLIMVASIVSAVADAIQSWPLLLTGMALYGVGQGGTILSRQAFVSEVVSKSYRGSVSSLQGGISRVAFAIGPVVGGLVMDSVGIIAVFSLQLLLAMACALLTVYYRRGSIPASTPASPKSHLELTKSGHGVSKTTSSSGNLWARKSAQGHSKGHGMLPQLDVESATDYRGRVYGKNGRVGSTASSDVSSRFFSLVGRGLQRLRFKLFGDVELLLLTKLGVFVIVLQIVRESRKLLMPLMGTELDMSTGEVGFYTSLSFAVDASLFLLAGYLMDTYGSVATGLCSLGILSLSLLVVVAGLSTETMLVSTIVAGIGNGLSSGIVINFGADHAPEGPSRGRFLGLFRMMADVGETAGPLLAGYTSEQLSVGHMVILVAVVGLLGCLWIYLCMGSDRPSSQLKQIENSYSDHSNSFHSEEFPDHAVVSYSELRKQNYGENKARGNEMRSLLKSGSTDTTTAGSESDSGYIR